MDGHPNSTKEFSIGTVDRGRGRRRRREARAADCFAPAPITVSLRKGASREVGQRRPRRAAGQWRGEGFRVQIVVAIVVAIVVEWIVVSIVVAIFVDND